ncbi:MAG TPA: type II secretion system protein [Sideroxyarcus sp.]|nr:type II secretion system protein [Sideroxyarcus sp.]
MTIIFVMGVVLASAGEVWHLAAKREKEQELLFVDNQFRQAIKLYYEHTPPQALRYPVRLEDLLADPRYPSTQRYLRKIYADPISGSTKWGVVKGPAGEILGVHSLSTAEPVKKSNFSIVDKNFENKTKYTDWVFMYAPGQYPASPLQRR